MKKLIVPEIDPNSYPDLDLAGPWLEIHAEVHSVETVNWPEFPYRPDVKFRIAHGQDTIFLKFEVKEQHIRGLETRVNGDVYKDSCVEFFLSVDGKRTYYNFEFNCIGTPHVGYGPGREGRELIDPAILEQVKVRSSLGDQPVDKKGNGQTWSLMAAIPRVCLIHDPDLVLKGLKAHANFYKCGDETDEPHFVTWNPVGTGKPDYHQSAFFGELLFE
jgi:hypothetical protein